MHPFHNAPSQTHDILVCDSSSPIQKCCTPPEVQTAHTSAAIVMPRLKNRPGHTIRQGLSIPNLGTPTGSTQHWRNTPLVKQLIWHSKRQKHNEVQIKRQLLKIYKWFNTTLLTHGYCKACRQNARKAILEHSSMTEKAENLTSLKSMLAKTHSRIIREGIKSSLFTHPPISYPRLHTPSYPYITHAPPPTYFILCSELTLPPSPFRPCRTCRRRKRTPPRR